MTDLKKAAQRAILLVDLTDLNDGSTQDDINTLCERANTPHGPVAAVCIWPRFVPHAKALLSGTGINVATVANFPDGSSDVENAAHEAARAIADGADEVDIVIPWRAIRDGDTAIAAQVVAACRREVPQKLCLKVILETGELADEATIRSAARIALENGADFIKTSTGKVPVNATPEAAAIMLEEIAASGKNAGFKAAGGIKTTSDAATYLAIADKIMGPDWASPQTLRFGASGVLGDLLACLGAEDQQPANDGY